MLEWLDNNVEFIIGYKRQSLVLPTISIVSKRLNATSTKMRARDSQFGHSHKHRHPFLYRLHTIHLHHIGTDIMGTSILLRFNLMFRLFITSLTISITVSSRRVLNVYIGESLDAIAFSLAFAEGACVSMKAHISTIVCEMTSHFYRVQFGFG